MIIFYLLVLISFDIIIGILLFLLWRYLDCKYFSTSEIELLKNENEYLKQENKKVSCSSSEFYGG